MHSYLRSLVVLSAVLLCAFSEHDKRPVLRLPRDADSTGHYIAVLKDDTTHERLLEVVNTLNAIDGCVVHRYVEVALKAIVLEVSGAALEEVRSIPEVVYIEEEGVFRAATMDTNTIINRPDLWYQRRIDALPGDGRGIDVYILDTGIRFQHTQFDSRVKYGGYDAVDQYEWEKETADYVPMHGKDCHGHGTAVASLVGGRTFGKATRANLYSVRVLRCDTTAPWSVVLDGLNYVAEIIPKRGHNAIVLLALSGSNTAAVNDALTNLNSLGVIVVAAAGNDGTNACETSPASSENIITVGSTDRSNTIASFSNYGPCVDLFAPGEDIFAANNECDSCTGTMSGTTLSAALTAGVVAAYFSELPHFTPALMKERILYQCLPGAINFDPLQEGAQAGTPNLLLKRGCGGVVNIDNTTRGVLTSPDFPENYLNNLRCKWTLVTERDHIQIDFSHIMLEENYDTLTICLKDECSRDGELVLTGDYGTPDCTLESKGRYMTVELRTDGFVQAIGFSATYFAIDTADSKRNTSRCSRVEDSSVWLDVYSAAHSVGNRFSMYKGWDEFFAGRKYGINVAVMDEVNGSVLVVDNFDQKGGGSTALGVFIEKIPPGRIVCVAISDNGVYQLSEYARRSLTWLGSNRILSLNQPDSWALIGVKGKYRPHNHAIDVSSGDSPARVTARVHLKKAYQEVFEITAVSNGYHPQATITLNGSVVDIPYVGHDRGLHVLVVDGVTGMIVHRQVFDTSAGSGAYSSSDQFVTLIQAQPEGMLVAIAIKEEGMVHMSDDAKRACESIGSAMIWVVGHGHSWAIVGRKGAEIGTVPEATQYNGISRSKLRLSKPDGDGILCPVLAQVRKNNGIGSSITVNGTKLSHSDSSTKGNLAILLEDNDCAVDRSLSFTTSDDLFDFMKAVPPARVVLIALAYDYRGLADYAATSLEAIGSARVRGQAFGSVWAIFGMKGAPIGTAVEDSAGSEPGKAFGATIRVGRSVVGHVTVQSAGANTGDYGRVGVNGGVIEMSRTYDCGLNVVVFEGDTTKIRSSKTFNMTASNNSQDIENFVKLTESLPDDTMIALASNNARDLNKVEKVQRAIKSLGSKYINQTIEGGCWALLGRKGARPGEVLEAVSDHGPVEIVSRAMTTTPVARDNSYCKILVESIGTGSSGGVTISVNGRYNKSLQSGEGVTVAILKNDACELESMTTFHSWYRSSNAEQVASFIKAVPSGRIVIVSTFTPTRSYTSRIYPDNLKSAMDYIGSSLFRSARYRDTWAIIGRKGAPVSSVPESLVGYSGVGNPVVSVGGMMKLVENKRELCEKEIYLLGCLDHTVPVY